MIEQKSWGSRSMNYLNDLGVICLKFTKIRDRWLFVFFGFLKNHFQVFSLQGEIQMESMISYLACLDE